MADGPVLEDPGVIAQRMMGSTNSGGGGQPKKDDITEYISSLFGRLFGIKMESLVNTGLFVQLTPPQQAFLSKSMNLGAATLTAPGGAATKFAMESLRIATINKFDTLAKPQINGFPVQPMSYAALGTLTPLDTGSSSSSRQLG